MPRQVALAVAATVPAFAPSTGRAGREGRVSQGQGQAVRKLSERRVGTHLRVRLYELVGIRNGRAVGSARLWVAVSV